MQSCIYQIEKRADHCLFIHRSNYYSYQKNYASQTSLPVDLANEHQGKARETIVFLAFAYQPTQAIFSNSSCLSFVVSVLYWRSSHFMVPLHLVCHHIDFSFLKIVLVSGFWFLINSTYFLYLSRPRDNSSFLLFLISQLSHLSVRFRCINIIC